MNLDMVGPKNETEGLFLSLTKEMKRSIKALTENHKKH